MAHEDEGHYAGKHPPGAEVDSTLAEAVRGAAEDGMIACLAAEAISNDKAVSMGEVGKTADLLEIRICECQMGLFGHSRGAHHGKRVEPASEVGASLEKQIREALVDGRLPCAAAWGIGSKTGLGKLEVASACEALKIKIKPCQLGAF